MTATATKTPEALLIAAGVEWGYDWEDAIREAIEPEGRMVNNGIGPYEYWGFKCRQDIWEFECEDSGEITIEWCDLEPPDLEALKRYQYVEGVPIATSEYDSEDYDAEVTVRLVTITTEYRSEVVEGGERIHYWKNKATLEWEATSGPSV
ncbi:MAG: hypothetical protein AMK75_02580 [Planctomycetes bacterium SM23_65]|nr:MAG: hypothetical protein AMK75_02580 [Planctomycetes bacterium SM23_65]